MATMTATRPKQKPTASLKWSSYIPQTPTPRQAVFLSLSGREAFYGGSAGGGKSSALLMAALQYTDVPGYAAILFRRTYADLALPDALMDRAAEWLGPTDACWRAQEKRWEFPSGASLSFGYLDSQNDRFRYQSAAFQYVAFDELTQFRELDYRYLFSRLRRLEGVKVPLRMRAASNPGGIGHEWVRQRFIDQDEHETDRVFIRALLDDNPHLDREAYTEALNELDPVTRQQLLDGDWAVREQGGMFRREDFILVEPDEVPSRGISWVRFWDLAGTQAMQGQRADQAATAGVLMGRAGDMYYVADVQRERLDPAGVEMLLIGTADRDCERLGSVAIRQEQEPGSSGKFVVADFAKKLVGYDFRGRPATGSKEERARPFAAAVANGLVCVVRGAWNGTYFDELEAFPGAGVTRDQVDASSGAFAELAKPQGITRSYQG